MNQMTIIHVLLGAALGVGLLAIIYEIQSANTLDQRIQYMYDYHAQNMQVIEKQILTIQHVYFDYSNQTDHEIDTVNQNLEKLCSEIKNCDWQASRP